ncbi:MAG: DUF4129 domain-containing protein [Pseudonocardia sp.]|nr:DUF4129 domain-containing protein [Pseudonocardia sp.]
MLSDIPVDIGRDDAREAAQRELAKAIYSANRPSWLGRVVWWLLKRLDELLYRAQEMGPGGYLGLSVLVLVLVLIVVAMRLSVGRIRRVAGRDRMLFGDQPRSAEDHRHAAGEHAGRGEWADAVRERLRAIMRDLQERDLLDARPGMTASEAATEAGRALPDCARSLAEAAGIFEDVWYGGRAATTEMDERLRAIDTQIRRARPTVTAGAW